MKLEHANREVETKFSEVIEGLRSRFLIFGAEIKQSDDEADNCYYAVVVKEPDGLRHGFRLPKKIFNGEADRIRDYMAHGLEQSGFHTWDDYKTQFVYFEKEHRTQREAKLRCKDCPACICSGGVHRCHYIEQPGLETDEDSECRYGITGYEPGSAVTGYTLKLRGGADT